MPQNICCSWRVSWPSAPYIRPQTEVAQSLADRAGRLKENAELAVPWSTDRTYCTDRLCLFLRKWVRIDFTAKQESGKREILRDCKRFCPKVKKQIYT